MAAQIGPGFGNSAVLSSVVSDVKQSVLGSTVRSRTARSVNTNSAAHVSATNNGSAAQALTGGDSFNINNPEGGEGEAVALPQINQRAVYGLYCSWAIAGLMYGFVFNYINIPLCQYVFGPMGAPGRATLAQCNISQTFTCLPWNFQVFYGLFLDRVGLFGTRRKGWVVFGWSMSLCTLVVIAFVADGLQKKGDIFTYMLMLLIMCIFYIFSTVSCDGLTIEFGKMEPPEHRGYILTTGQMVRFGAQVVVNLVGIFGMNGKFYYPKDDSRENDTIFPFELPFWSIHLVLIAMALPLFIAMIYLLEDPPSDLEEHHSLKAVGETLWTVLKTKVVFCLIVFCISSTAIAALQNPGLNVIANIVAPSTFQLSVGTLIGNTLFLLGVWIFRTYFMNKNWRFTFIWTALLLASNGGLQLMMIFNTGGWGQTGWFYAFGSNIMLLVQGVQQVLSSLSVIEISPPGFEASVYEFLISVGNSGIALNGNIMNFLLPIFGLNGIAPVYHTVDKAERDHYNDLLAKATYFTIIVNAVAALTFCWFLPKGKQQCHEWNALWKRPMTGIFNLSLGWIVLLFSLTLSLLSSIPSTCCLKIAGGDGC